MGEIRKNQRRTWDSNPEISSSVAESSTPETGALTITPVRLTFDYPQTTILLVMTQSIFPMSGPG